MAEVAGIVVGVVGLAGLIGAFKDTIDLFNDFADSRDLGRDYEILDAKVDIERTILLQWVDRVNLLRPNYDRRLDDDHTQQALTYFVTKLNQIMPTQDGFSMTDEDIEAIRDLRELKTLLAASLGHRKVVAESTAKHIERVEHACEDRILQTLWYRMMDDRHESLAPAHNRTLQWALEPPSGKEFFWHDLSKWLRCGSGIYWASGKAGSGKSTLMKHVFHHDKTQLLLSQWAEDQDISIAQFFFFNLGTTLQKSQEGLSRALLYQIFSKHHSLIAEALPNMWKQLQATVEDVDLPSPAETKHAFHVITKHSSRLGKFCFFIDGLDEFVGNYLDGIAFIKELAANDNIKIVVSSRPIPDCVASFEGLPTLQLQDLTRDDIRSYVQDVIGSHKYMQRLIDRDPEEAKEIMEDIVTKSSGVFLWVILACRSLISGFSAYDRTSELRKRVDELPPELEQMFDHMLSKIDRRNREQGARLLRMCYTASAGRDRIPDRNRDRIGSGAVSTLTLALMDDGPIDAGRIYTLPKKQKRGLCEEVEGRLRSRCGGLLELAKGICFCRGDGLNGEQHHPKIDTKVTIMHRTVFEFLGSERVWELECLQAPHGSDSYADLSLERLYSAILLYVSTNREQANELLQDALEWGQKSDCENPEGRRNMFWILEGQLNILPRPPGGLLFPQLCAMSSHNTIPGHSHAALILATEVGAVNYVKRHPEFPRKGESTADSCDCPPLLYHAIAGPILQEAGLLPPFLIAGYNTSEMVSLALSSGADPNEKMRIANGPITTPWFFWKQRVTATYIDVSMRLEASEITAAFLKAGAIIDDRTQDWIGKLFLNTSDPLVIKKREELLELVASLKRAKKRRKRPTKGNIADWRR
ncbi:hypothetical protein BDV96DRAFT_504494 [Lophiotrema nucula]|uniref:NACHT domain-containing protein n=1 Tax=Lophiotrema nucula TaxID=690887 RepID=A0A6A5YMM1_9PLEO|nr:hypothetical protein BDV96DRAFT_504494 [Lophiotrema nucula]